MAVYKASNSGLLTRTEYSSFLAGNIMFDPFEPVSGFDSIATVTVGAGGTNNITFSSIPQNYTHLQLRYITRNTAVTDSTYMRVNGDDVQNYSYHMLRGNGTSATATAATTQSVVELPFTAYSGTTANVFTAGVLDILDYSNTSKYKTFRTLGGADLNGSGAVNFVSGSWRSTSAITSIVIYVAPTSIAQYSQFALYGIRGN